MFRLLILFVAIGLTSCSSTLVLKFNSKAGSAVGNDAIDEKIQERFEDLDDSQLSSVLLSEDSLPAGLSLVEGKLINQKGYQHKVLGHFELMTNNIANKGLFYLLPSPAYIKQEAKRVVVAAGGDFALITDVKIFARDKAGGLTAWAAKLDPKVKQKLKAKK